MLWAALFVLAITVSGESCSPARQTTWAGQTIDAGTVEVTNSDSRITLTVTAKSGWYFQAAHVWVGTSGPAPTVPGKFPYVREFTPCTSYSISVSFPAGTTCSSNVAIAFHLDAVKFDSKGKEVASETGWAGDVAFSGPKWGFWFNYKASCGCETTASRTPSITRSPNPSLSAASTPSNSPTKSLTSTAVPSMSKSPERTPAAEKPSPSKEASCKKVKFTMWSGLSYVGIATISFTNSGLYVAMEALGKWEIASVSSWIGTSKPALTLALDAFQYSTSVESTSGKVYFSIPLPDGIVCGTRIALTLRAELKRTLAGVSETGIAWAGDDIFFGMMGAGAWMDVQTACGCAGDSSSSPSPTQRPSRSPEKSAEVEGRNPPRNCNDCTGTPFDLHTLDGAVVGNLMIFNSDAVITVVVNGTAGWKVDSVYVWVGSAGPAPRDWTAYPLVRDPEPQRQYVAMQRVPKGIRCDDLAAFSVHVDFVRLNSTGGVVARAHASSGYETYDAPPYASWGYYQMVCGCPDYTIPVDVDNPQEKQCCTCTAPDKPSPSPEAETSKAAEATKVPESSPKARESGSPAASPAPRIRSHARSSGRHNTQRAMHQRRIRDESTCVRATPAPPPCPADSGTSTYTIYASKSSYPVGTLTISNVGFDIITFDITMKAGISVPSFALYVGTSTPATNSPGQLGYEFAPPSANFSLTITRNPTTNKFQPTLVSGSVVVATADWPTLSISYTCFTSLYFAVHFKVVKSGVTYDPKLTSMPSGEQTGWVYILGEDNPLSWENLLGDNNWGGALTWKPCCYPPPSISCSRTASSTNTATASTTNTATASKTASSTNTATASQTASTTKTATASRTASTTKTATASQTASTTNTATASRTSSTTNTATASQTASTTHTATASQTASTTNTATASQTATTTNTATASQTASTTNTATSSQTPSTTNTATASQTASTTNTATASQTPSTTNTATATRTASTTNTATASQTASTTNTATASQTASTTNTATASQTASSTNTATASQTASTTTTATASQTASSTNTATASQTASTTNTATASRTASSTNTATASQTPSSSSTPSVSPTVTPTSSPVDLGCTLTQGYWKNHNKYASKTNRMAWPAPASEDDTLCGQRLIDVLWTSPRGDAWYILAHQWIAAMLNQANGASVSSVADALVEGGNLLRNNCGAFPAATRDRMIALSALLDDFNNGNVGPPHCSDGGDKDPVCSCRCIKEGESTPTYTIKTGESKEVLISTDVPASRFNIKCSEGTVAVKIREGIASTATRKIKDREFLRESYVVVATLVNIGLDTAVASLQVGDDPSPSSTPVSATPAVDVAVATVSSSMSEPNMDGVIAGSVTAGVALIVLIVCAIIFGRKRSFNKLIEKKEPKGLASYDTSSSLDEAMSAKRSLLTAPSQRTGTRFSSETLPASSITWADSECSAEAPNNAATPPPVIPPRTEAPPPMSSLDTSFMSSLSFG